MNLEILRELADRCVAMAARVSVPIDDGRSFSLSISAGATLARPEEDPLELIRRVDELMYQSKERGRNRASIQ